MDKNTLLTKIRNGEIDCNNSQLFFSILIKGLIYNLNKDITIRGVPVPHFILSTGNEYMYLEVKGQDIKKDVPNEDYIYNTIPRCIVTIGGVDLLTDQLTNPYIKGQFEYETEDGIFTLAGDMRRIPLKISVDLIYYLDNYLDSLSLMQQWITKQAFVKTFPVVYMGQRINSSYSMPETFEDEHMMDIEQSTQDNRYHQISMSLELETNMPTYDSRTIISCDDVVANLEKAPVRAVPYKNGWNPKYEPTTDPKYVVQPDPIIINNRPEPMKIISDNSKKGYNIGKKLSGLNPNVKNIIE